MHLEESSKYSARQQSSDRGSEQVRGVRMAERCWWHIAFGTAALVGFAIRCLCLLGEEERRLMVSVPGNTGTPQWPKGNIPGSTKDHNFTPKCLLAKDMPVCFQFNIITKCWFIEWWCQTSQQSLSLCSVGFACWCRSLKWLSVYKAAF